MLTHPAGAGKVRFEDGAGTGLEVPGPHRPGLFCLTVSGQPAPARARRDSARSLCDNAPQ